MAKGNIKQSKSKDSTDPLTSVLKGGVGKASTAPVAKTKQMAKDVAKKVIPKAVESSDEDSEDDSEDSASDSEDSGSDSSDSEAEEKPKTNGTSKAKGKAETSDDSASDSDSDSDDEVPAKAATNGTNGTKVNGKAAAPASPSTDSSDSDSEEDSGDEVKAAATKNIDTKTKVNGDAKDDESGSDDNSEDSSGSDEDSEDSEDSETETKPKEKAEAPSKKRKADADDEPVEKKAKMDTGSGSSTLWVGNLGWKVDDNVLYEEFKFCGDIVSARVVTDRESGRSRGFGYVDFSSHEAAQKAYDEKSGAYLEGRDMRLDFADKSGSNNKPAQSPGARAKKFGDTVSPESDTLFVGNLSFQADEDSVSAFFSDVANVKSLRLPTDQESGRMKGFGYVTFYSIEDAKKAFEALNGESCAGRNVRLDYSTPRPPREGGFGGRGGGRGGGDFGGRGGGRGRGGFGGRGGGRGGFNRGGGGGGFQGKRVSFD